MFEAAADPPPEGDDHPADGAEVRGVEESVLEAVRGLASVLEIDPEDLSGGERGELVAALASVAGRVDAALCRAVGSFAAHGDHTGDGARSAGSWIAARTELSATAARDLAHRGVVLRDCPGVTEAYGAGVIGTGKVRALLAARDGIEDLFAPQEAHLVDVVADLSVRHANVVLARWRELALARRSTSPDDPPPDPEADNSVTISPGFEGRRIITGSLDALAGAELENLVAAEVDRRFRTGAFSTDDGHTPGRRRAIALRALVRRGAAHTTGEDRIRPAVTILVDLATLLGLPATSTPNLLGRRCELADGTTIGLHRVLEAMADATINTVLGHAHLTGTFHPVGEITANRSANARQRRMLAVRDQTCAYPGCDQPGQWTDAHHLDGWHHTHQTTVPRLALLCRFHHHHITHAHNGFTVTGDHHGHLTVTRPDGTTIDPTPPGFKINHPTHRRRPPPPRPTPTPTHDHTVHQLTHQLTPALRNA